MGIKGTVRRSTDGDFIHANVDIDLIITEEPEMGNVEKPVEIFHIIEHFCLGRRRLHLFGRDSTIRPGQLNANSIYFCFFFIVFLSVNLSGIFFTFVFQAGWQWALLSQTVTLTQSPTPHTLVCPTRTCQVVQKKLKGCDLNLHLLSWSQIGVVELLEEVGVGQTLAEVEREDEKETAQISVGTGEASEAEEDHTGDFYHVD